jgi:hypothetical protein
VGVGVYWEWRALNNPVLYAEIVAALLAAAVVARWRAGRVAKSDDADVQFEEAMPPVLQTLGLRFDPTNG